MVPKDEAEEDRERYMGLTHWHPRDPDRVGTAVSVRRHVRTGAKSSEPKRGKVTWCQDFEES